MVTGAHPILPLDVQKATWLVKLPDWMLTTEELIGYRARALAKHRIHVADMHKRVSLEKQICLVKNIEIKLMTEFTNQETWSSLEIL